VSRKVSLAAVPVARRNRVAEILRSSQLFRDDEVDVALELFDQSLQDDRDYVFVGAYGTTGELTGFACYGPTPDTDRTYDLYWIAVDMAAQSAGSGTTLLEEVERRLQEQDARLVVVETSSRPDYEGTRNFYLRRGYQEAARVKDFYGPSDGRVIFTKRLTENRTRLAAHGVVSHE
jgi:ribosomal protein S18 acetylase RimI-like enzyme